MNGCQYCNNEAELSIEPIDDVIVYINDKHELVVMGNYDFTPVFKKRINVCPVCGVVFPEEVQE